VARRLVELLFESESGGGNLATLKEARPITTGATQWRAATSSTGTPTDLVQCLTTKGGNRLNVYEESYILEARGTNMPTTEVVGTLAPGAHGAGPKSVNGQDAYSGQLIPVQLAVQSAVDVAENQRNEVRFSSVASCVSQGGGRPGQGRNVVMYDQPEQSAPVGSFTADGSNIVVRRLTPLECERLMGWPDRWTAEGIDDDGNNITIPATQRYRICGNGIVANVTEWLGARLERLTSDHQPPTQTEMTSENKKDCT
jgi:DNA (cytosine-5)-methyltransferase 1